MSQWMSPADHKKRHRRLLRQVGRAIETYQLIEDGDKIMVCLSGGKDSYVMLDLLLDLQRKAPISFEILAVNLDQGHPGFPTEVLPDYLSSRDIPFKILKQDTYSVVQELIPPGKTTCSLCSRLRRGILYTEASRLGITKIALGHHRDDLVETLFLNMFYNGKLMAMAPKLLADEGRHVVIRPLCLARESDIAAFAAYRQFPIIPCNLCGSQENLKRKMVKRMLQAWEAEDPGRADVIFASLQNVEPEHLADTEMFDFANLKRQKDPATRLHVLQV